MITEQDLQEAIAECMGERNPNANTCVKLAAYYTIRNELYGQTPVELPAYSRAGAYTSSTAFGELANSKPTADVLSVMDELMESLKVMFPRVYDATMSKLKTL